MTLKQITESLKDLDQLELEELRMKLEDLLKV